VGKRFLRSIVVDETTLAATGDITPVDLPTNPLSFLVLTVSLERPDEDATSAHRILSDAFLGIGDISVRHDGEQIIQGSLADLTMMAAMLTGYVPHGAAALAWGNSRPRLPDSFTRKPYWHEEAYRDLARALQVPHERAGRQPRQRVRDELPARGARADRGPAHRFLKYTTLTRALRPPGSASTATREPDSPVLLFSPATEITATEASAFGKVQIVKDNVQQYYIESNWEALRADMANRCPSIGLAMGHMHASDGTAVPTGDEMFQLNRPPAQYGYLDLDPLKDDSFALDTEGVSDLELDLNSDVSTGTARYLPVERVAVA
jgi:hypothetical protein